MKEQLLIVIDSSGEEHHYQSDDKTDFYHRYEDGVLTISVNSGAFHENGDGAPWPSVDVAMFYLPRLMRIHWI